MTNREELIALLKAATDYSCVLQKLKCTTTEADEDPLIAIADHLLANGVSIQIDNEKRVAKKDEEWRIPNIEFGTKKLGGMGPLDPFVVSVWWKMNVRGERYGDYILFDCDTDSTYSVPCDEVIDAVNELLEQARNTYEYLEAKQCGVMATCKDCLHYDVCERYGRTVDFSVDDGVCLDFKDRSRYVVREKGEWILGAVEPGYCTPGGNRPWICPKCGSVISWRLDKPTKNFCPQCGSDMRKEN